MLDQIQKFTARAKTDAVLRSALLTLAAHVGYHTFQLVGMAAWCGFAARRTNGWGKYMALSCFSNFAIIELHLVAPMLDEVLQEEPTLGHSYDAAARIALAAWDEAAI